MLVFVSCESIAVCLLGKHCCIIRGATVSLQGPVDAMKAANHGDWVNSRNNKFQNNKAQLAHMFYIGYVLMNFMNISTHADSRYSCLYVQSSV